MASTSIEWTDRVWNPVTGCTKVSAGCRNCYAETIADRFWATQYPRVHGLSENIIIDRPRRFTDVMTHEDRLLEPLSWRKPSTVFVNSMSDLFHEDVPAEFIGRVFSVMALAERHTFQVLTKRPERMRRWFAARRFDVKDYAILHTEQAGECLYAHPWPLPNVWLGVSVEDQPRADERITLLLQTPAAVRFLSCEPLLGPIDLSPWLGGSRGCSEERRGTGNGLEDRSRATLDWIICGGESGPGARPCNLEWVRSIVEQCHAARVACFVKQLGAKPFMDEPTDGISITLDLCDRKGGDWSEWPEFFRRREFPEKVANG